MKKETFLLFVLLFVNTCWTAPHRPASLEVAGLADLRKSQQTVTDKSMVYWLVVVVWGGLTCLKQKSRRDTQPCRANSRQHTAVTFTARGGKGGHHSQGKQKSGWLIGDQETSGTVGPGTPVVPDFSPMVKRTGCSGGTKILPVVPRYY